MREKRIFKPMRTDDLHPSALPWVGKEVTVESWHDNYSMRDRYPKDDAVGFIKEFLLDIPESELVVAVCSDDYGYCDAHGYH